MRLLLGSGHGVVFFVCPWRNVCLDRDPMNVSQFFVGSGSKAADCDFGLDHVGKRS
ncbi:hypothetical protein SynA1825c_02949 [Synechococcus sp. A18-25c]|nr:hypothetical protein SynA1825c_02949 [Synechococcus sp. A18-25c]